MPLCKTVNFKGITVVNALIVVSQFSGDKNKLQFTVTYHKDAEKEAFDAKNFETSLDLNGGNPLKQAYDFLKLQPEFEGAIDLGEDSQITS